MYCGALFFVVLMISRCLSMFLDLVDLFFVIDLDRIDLYLFLTCVAFCAILVQGLFAVGSYVS